MTRSGDRSIPPTRPTGRPGRYPRSTREAKRQRAARLDWLKVWGPAVLLSALGLALCWWLIEPAPPGRVRLAAGPATGAYHATATRYQAIFADYGLELEVLQTAGTVENYALLQAGEADLALVQSGLAPKGPSAEGLRAIASVFYEPIFVFLSDNISTQNGRAGGFVLDDLSGLRVSVGPPGSGTHDAALELLDVAGVREKVRVRELPTAEGKKLLAEGRIDALFVVISPDSPLIAELLALDGIRLASFRRARALARKFPAYDAVTLYEGAVSLPGDLPRRDVNLVAPAALVVGSRDTHNVVVRAAVRAAQQVHASGDALSPAGEFPSAAHADLPISDEALHYLKNGPGFLQRTLPFWAAGLLDRAVLFLIPLAGLLIPLLRIAPPTYRWQVRRKIYRWYGRLREVDDRLEESLTGDELAEVAMRLGQLDREVREVNVPLSFTDELYDLRLHIRMLDERVANRVAKQVAVRTGVG